LPRAVIEAMSRGCPVIASSVAGTPELLPVDYLVPKGNTKALVDKIDYVLLNRRLWPDIARENFERSKEYTDEVLKLRRQKFYSQLAEAAKKSANPCID